MSERQQYSEGFEGTIKLVEALVHTSENERVIVITLINDRLKDLTESEQKFVSTMLPFDSGLSDDDVDAQYNQIIEDCAALGFAASQYQMGCRLFEAGQSAEALKIYKLSADNGYAPSQYTYGLQVFRGDGAEKNEEEGLTYIQMAAGRLYILALEWLIAIHGTDGAKSDSEKEHLYIRMLSWADDPSL